MFKSLPVSEFVRRTAVLAAVLGASVAVMRAQSPDTAAGVTAVPQFSSSVASEDALTPATATAAAPNVQLASSALHFNLFGNNMQYGGRQTYGRPRYRGSNTNADGSPKYDFYAGAGFGVPTSTTSNNFTTSYGIQAGGGRMFNRALGVNLEFDFDHFGMNSATIGDYLYVNTGSTSNSYGIQGNMHVWNISLQPIYNIRSGAGVGAYITGGVGFYHKVSNFTAPQQGVSCYYYCYSYITNSTFDHYTSNAPGFDGGAGITYKFSRFSNQMLYGEIRYVYMANQFKPGVTDANYLTYNGYNYFPANSNTTTYFPVKFGLRF